MKTYIDLRSDTVTKPTQEMRNVIANAEVGDDVFDDDVTVNLLQEKTAKLLGKEAALFTPSGTMANLIAFMTHTQPADEVIVEKGSHTFNYEVAGASALGGVQLNTLIGKRGILKVTQIEETIRINNVHVPATTLISLENTHNRGGGTIYPIEKIKAISELASSKNIKMHLDGARLFNACVAANIEAKEYAQYFDSLMFCFSKGLGAPVGSILAGSKSFIKKAHRYRKMLGGAMRQVGILASAAIYALDNNIERLADDHEHAKLLADGISKLDGFKINTEEVETNILIFDISESDFTVNEILEKLEQSGVLMIGFGPTLIRAVTNLDVSRSDIEKTIKVLKNLFG